MGLVVEQAFPSITGVSHEQEAPVTPTKRRKLTNFEEPGQMGKLKKKKEKKNDVCHELDLKRAKEYDELIGNQ